MTVADITPRGVTCLVINRPTWVDLQNATPEPVMWFLLSTSLTCPAAFGQRRR